jgi:hypothetical protein
MRPFQLQSELARWRVRMAWMRLVIQIVEQRSLQRMRPGIEGGDGLFDQPTDSRVGPVDGLLTGRRAVSSAAVRETDRAACALTALARKPARPGDSSVV